VEIPPETRREIFQKSINCVTSHLVGNISKGREMRYVDCRRRRTSKPQYARIVVLTAAALMKTPGFWSTTPGGLVVL